jgi:uncharacterized protein YxeA
MKKIMTLMLGMSLVLGAASVAFAQSTTGTGSSSKKASTKSSTKKKSTKSSTASKTS